MEKITIGNWWQPGNPEKTLVGSLISDQKLGWILDLKDSFAKEIDVSELATGSPPIFLSQDHPGQLPVILGMSGTGERISLMDCQVLNYSVSIPPWSNGSLKLWPTVIVYGVHFESSDDFRLTSLHIRYSNLDQWVGKSGFRVKPSSLPYPIEFSYNVPDPIEAVVSEDLRVSIAFSASGPTMPVRSDLRITQQSWLSVTSGTGLPFDKLLAHNTDFANLVSLGVGGSLRPLEMRGKCNARDHSGATASASLKLIHNREPLTPESPDLAPWDMLFTLDDIHERFNDMITSWFGKDDAIRSLYALYFGTLRSPFMYVEHRFLNMFQAIESYDRRTSQFPAKNEEARKQRVDRILACIDNAKDREWAGKKLCRRQEPTAEDRIKHVAENMSAGWLMTPENIRLAAVLRNYHTHFDKKAEEFLPPVEERFLIMNNLAARLRVLCELVLLKSINLQLDEMRDRMIKTRHLERYLIDVGQQTANPPGATV